MNGPNYEQNGACGFRVEHGEFPSGAFDKLFESPYEEGCQICDLSYAVCQCGMEPTNELTPEEIEELEAYGEPTEDSPKESDGGDDLE